MSNNTEIDQEISGILEQAFQEILCQIVIAEITSSQLFSEIPRNKLIEIFGAGPKKSAQKLLFRIVVEVILRAHLNSCLISANLQLFQGGLFLVDQKV